MLRHVVMFRFTPGTTDEQRDALLVALQALPAQIPEIREYQVGRDARLRAGTFELGVVALFDDEAAWRAYLAHPAHVAVVDDHVTPIVSDRASIQFTV